MSKKVLIDNNSNNIAQTFKPVTILIDNNPDNIFQSGILDVSIKRLLPKKPNHKPIVKKHR